MAKEREVIDLAYSTHKYLICLLLTDYETTFAKEGGPRSRGDGDQTTITTQQAHAPRHVLPVTI